MSVISGTAISRVVSLATGFVIAVALTAIGADEFTRLDANGDGVITASEWRGPLRAFRQRDFNADGVVTRRELFLDRGGLEEGGFATADISVSGRQRWKDTGLTVHAGDTVTLVLNSAVRSPGPPASLIARIGRAAPVVIGELGVIKRAPVGGRLYLGVNGDRVRDDSADYLVTVTIE